MTTRADADCCLSDLGSLKTPTCIIAYQRERAMAKGGAKGMDSPEGACQGRSLVEMMEDELDDVVNRLMDKGDYPSKEMDKGQALGIATCIAIIQAPYYPNVDSVRADSVRRYEWRKAHPPSWSTAGSRASETDDLETGTE